MLLKSYAFTTVAGPGTGLNAVVGSAAVILRPSRWLWDTGVIALLASYIPARRAARGGFDGSFARGNEKMEHPFLLTLAVLTKDT